MKNSSVLRRRRRRRDDSGKGGPAKRFLGKIKPGVEDHVRFLGAFLTRPTAVGALGPSSRWLAADMLRGCALEEADTVVELGPGTGVFTRAILSRIGTRTTFFAMELCPLFARGLTRRFPGLTVYNDSAEKLVDYLSRHGKTRVDYIFSGLPWASIPLEIQTRVLGAVLTALAPGGVFTTFGYLHARWMPNAVRFRNRLLQHFSSVETSRAVWRNFPPAFIYRCRR
jgi:phospholipid N-methyltransferase